MNKVTVKAEVNVYQVLREASHNMSHDELLEMIEQINNFVGEFSFTERVIESLDGTLESF